MADWANLQDEALEVLDSVGLTPNGFSNEIKTNFTNSMNVGGLHSDSKSGTLHLHIDCCRVDMEGNTNHVHDIHLRAMKAAEIINMRHGWEQPPGDTEYAEGGACGGVRNYLSKICNSST